MLMTLPKAARLQGRGSTSNTTTCQPQRKQLQQALQSGCWKHGVNTFRDTAVRQRRKRRVRHVVVLSKRDGGDELSSSPPGSNGSLGNNEHEPPEQQLNDLNGFGARNRQINIGSELNDNSFQNSTNHTTKNGMLGHNPVTASHGEDVKQFVPSYPVWMKFAPLSVMFFCASFNLQVLQNVRDAIVITTSGAEVLPFLAAYCVFPTSLAFFAYYTRLCSSQPRRRVFYLAVLPLLAVYAIFAAILFPASEQLHFQGLSNAAAEFMPGGLLGAVKVVENWTFSLFFVACELWGTVAISLLFWTTANEICTVPEAKSVYPLVGMSANFALIGSGAYIKWINAGPAAAGGIGTTLCWLVGTVLISTCIMFAARHYADSMFGPKPSIDDSVATEHKKSDRKDGKKIKSTFRQSLAVLKSNSRITNLATLVVGYGICHRLFEFAWKGQLKLLHPSPQAYQAVLSDVSIAVGVLATGLMLCGGTIFRRLGWFAAASATPSIMLVSGAAFFGLSMCASFGLLPHGMSPTAILAIGATAGAVTQVCCRSFKFSLFDPAREMVYIEMSKEEKSKGKAAVDLVGSQIGKTGASWVTQVLLLTAGSITAALPFTFMIYTIMIALWLRAVSNLDRSSAEDPPEGEQTSEAVLSAADEKATGDLEEDSNVRQSLSSKLMT